MPELKTDKMIDTILAVGRHLYGPTTALEIHVSTETSHFRVTLSQWSEQAEELNTALQSLLTSISNTLYARLDEGANIALSLKQS